MLKSIQCPTLHYTPKVQTRQLRANCFLNISTSDEAQAASFCQTASIFTQSQVINSIILSGRSGSRGTACILAHACLAHIVRAHNCTKLRVTQAVPAAPAAGQREIRAYANVHLSHSGLLGGTSSSCSLLHPIPGHPLVTKALQVPLVPRPHCEGTLLPAFDKTHDYLVRPTHTKFACDSAMDLQFPE